MPYSKSTKYSNENWNDFTRDPISASSSGSYTYTTSSGQYNYVYIGDFDFYAEFYPTKKSVPLRHT